LVAAYAHVGQAQFASLGVGAHGAFQIKKHFTGLTWNDNRRKSGFAFQADSSDIRLRNAWCMLLKN